MQSSQRQHLLGCATCDWMSANLHIEQRGVEKFSLLTFHYQSYCYMLPSLGLFKSIPCPLYPNCSRNPCFYSHKIQRTDDGRPSEQIKRQKLAPEPAAKAASPSSSSSIGKAAPTVTKGKLSVYIIKALF